MSQKKKSDPNPLSVQLSDLLLILEPTSIKAHQDGNAIIARHEHYTMRIEVIPPISRKSENGPIRAVVRVAAELPQPIQQLFGTPERTIDLNPFAALSALTYESGRTYIGSRLTIYEAEDVDVWRNLHLPLLAFTVIGGAEAILGGIRRALTSEGNRGGRSDWTDGDIQVHGYLSKQCVCTRGGGGLTAEFGLSEGAISAGAGSNDTALFGLKTDQPHPELGGGLFCLLQMPLQLRDKKTMQQMCVQLNNMEMAAHDLPPHFGAWCEGKLGNNPTCRFSRMHFTKFRE
jgi:hypothetical protein